MEISLYIHIPFCRQKCDYCDFFSIPASKNCLQPDRNYVTAVLNECRYFVKKYSITRWKTVYVGGGTPSRLSPELLSELVTGVKNLVSDKNVDEFTVEMNPEDITEGLLEAAEKSGINRISTGIQALDEKALLKINRHCTAKTAVSALKLLQKKWKHRLSVDFIAGLPGQTYKSFESQFEYIFKLNVDHISLYTLTVEENTPLYKKIKSGAVKWNPSKADRMWILGRNILEKNGFFQYEVSNFSKKGSESLHNQAYWQQKNYLGCGAGACGTIYDSPALRWNNTTSIQRYEDFWLKNGELPEKIDEKKLKTVRTEEKLSREILEFEYLMTGFRMLEGVCAEDFEEKFGKSLEERLGDKTGIFCEWERKKLAARYRTGNKTYFCLTRRGIMLLNLFLESLL